MLSAASCNKWLLEDIFGTSDYAAEQAPISDERLGENHVFFLPYLMGERSPINDTNARLFLNIHCFDLKVKIIAQPFKRTAQYLFNGRLFGL